MSDEYGNNPAPAPNLRGSQLEIALRRLTALTVQPPVMVRLLAEGPAGDLPPGRSPNHLVDLVGCDPALAARVLSACAGRLDGCASLEPALSRLAGDRLEALLLSTPLPADADAPAQRERTQLWHHCLATALAARELARRRPRGVDPDEAYLCGLLHDIGKLALADTFPREYSRVRQTARMYQGDVVVFERRMLGTDHVIFGRRLVQDWRLPQPVVSAVWMHHQPLEAIPTSVPHRRLVAVVGLADVLVRIGRIGDSGNPFVARLPHQLALGLQIPPHEVETLAERLPGMLAEHLAGLGVDSEPDPARLGQAQADANRRLGRLLSELMRRRQDEATRHMVLDHLTAILHTLQQSATLADFLAAAAAACHQLTGKGPLPALAYCLDRRSGEILLAASTSGDPQWRSLLCGPEALSGSGPSQAAPADAVLPSLLDEPSALSEWIDPARCTHLPLRWAGRWIGGLIHPAAGRTPAGGTATAQLAERLGPVLGLITARTEALALSDELAGASASLAGTQDAVAEQRTIEAIGQMAAGAAHELNTPLAVMSGRAQLMKEQASTARDRQAWALMAEQAQRISDTISALMDFASPARPNPSVFDPGELLHEAAEAFSSSNHPQARCVSLDKDIGEGLPSVSADRQQIRNVVLELITNAAHVTPPDGRIRLSAEADEVAKAVLLRVQDAGPGMDDDTLASAYTPFFSSHRAGRRTGLGLPRAKRYVEINGGRIWIQSRPGEGTTACVQLPVLRGRNDRGNANDAERQRQDPHCRRREEHP